MTNGNKVGDEKLKYDINRKAWKISALSSGKTDQYEYLTCEDILPSNQSQLIEQDKFLYFPFGKDFEKQTNKQTKNNWRSRCKINKAFRVFKVF